MKRCSQCNQTYTDETLSYCLSDGTPLTIDTEEKTMVMQKSPTRKKSKFLLWLGLIGLIILIGGGVIAGLLILNYSRQSESLRGERQNGAGLAASPTPLTLRVTPTPTSAMSSPVEESSPKTEELKPTPNNEDKADITPIAWDTTPSGFKGDDGQTYTFRCPEAGTENLIWGSDVYTQDSSICTAAVHVGRISLARGGIVTIEFRPGRSTYGSTVRNGIKSRTYGEYPHSFVVR
jgi:hypothetical protein